MVYEVSSIDTPRDDIVCEPLPIVVSGVEALGLCCEVFGCGTGQTSLILGNGGAFLEGLDVGEEQACTP